MLLSCDYFLFFNKNKETFANYYIYIYIIYIYICIHTYTSADPRISMHGVWSSRAKCNRAPRHRDVTSKSDFAHIYACKVIEGNAAYERHGRSYYSLMVVLFFSCHRALLL